MITAHKNKTRVKSTQPEHHNLGNGIAKLVIGFHEKVLTLPRVGLPACKLSMGTIRVA